MKKLLLINPVGQKSGYLLSKFSTFSPLGLGYVAAVTPANWDVKIADENFDPFVYEEADLVAITALTSNINRAYEIAGIYRKQNIKVIIGGIHASMYYDEVSQYADAVVVGEVEGIWEKVINDFENNRLSTKYIGPRIDLTQFNIRPRRELLHPHYLWNSVQTSRGCPFECHFCSVSRYLGKKYRQRKAEDVLDELEDIKSEYIAFVDDNLIGYSVESKTRAKNIFEGMIKRGLKKKWWMQTSINAAEDEQIVELAAKAGCMFVFIGFESISKNTLKDMKKEVNLKIGVDNYKRIVNTFHKHGIGILGAFITGNDFESPDYYKQLANFLVRSGIDVFQITMLTPLPGTRLMEKLIQENLLICQEFPQDWDKYRFSYMVHHPKEVEIDTIYIGNNYIKNRLYTFPNYQFRLLKSLLNLRNLTNFHAALKLNQALKKGWQNSHYFEKYPRSFQ